ncbi:HIT domain-containing protein [Cyanobium sp. Cruz CV13-4-11]|nr:HIT domain-containing protein [Cyanobium sp. Cruz CV11-17]MCP9921232.1 HIT domain-containing protein [Cyanobium sp. Cruz CV13-4-11]
MLLENELALCIADADPVTRGHSLVIPRRHVADGLALHQPEWNAVVELLKLRREQLSALKESSARECSLEELTVCRTMASQARVP